MTTNNKISSLVNTQLPVFIRKDHPNFIEFLEAYYRYLEQTSTTLQEGKAVERAKNMLSYMDIDTTLDDFTARLYDAFLEEFPTSSLVDKAFILKHAKDLYRAKGTEKSFRFMLRAIYGAEVATFYYPKKDILKFSDGKWYIQKVLKVADTTVNGVANNNLSGLDLFVNRLITGNTSGATAIIEAAQRTFETGTQVDELTVSSERGTFEGGETIQAEFTVNSSSYILTANIFGGILNTIEVMTPGSNYEVGDPVVFIGDGSGAVASVTAVSTGNVASIGVFEGGAGFRAGDGILFTGGGSGSGANAAVSNVTADSAVHPNTYNLVASQIYLEANTAINNTRYSNLNSSILDPANNWIQNVLSFFVYANTGPVRTILINSAGTGYSPAPEISVLANTRIRELGILGRMQILSGGHGYRIGDVIQFVGGLGAGAYANVTNVDTANSNTITAVKFQNERGHLTGGAGFDILELPTANVVSANANAFGAVIQVTELLGTGGSFAVSNSTLGAIETITITSRGRDYTEAPEIDLTGSGDGTAEAEATIIASTFSYPGRFLNDDGFLSATNYLEDSEYYQNYSYVIRIPVALSRYKNILKSLLHPAGMKMYGEYAYVSTPLSIAIVASANSNVHRMTIYRENYVKTGNTINISYTSHGLVNNANIYLEFTSAGAGINVFNSIYRVANSHTNWFNVTGNNAANNSGTVNVGITI